MSKGFNVSSCAETRCTEPSVCSNNFRDSTETENCQSQFKVMAYVPFICVMALCCLSHVAPFIPNEQYTNKQLFRDLKFSFASR
jgi:hypothetical protein